MPGESPELRNQGQGHSERQEQSKGRDPGTQQLLRHMTGTGTGGRHSIAKQGLPAQPLEHALPCTMMTDLHTAFMPLCPLASDICRCLVSACLPHFLQ